jgi:hypothetical protein
LPASIHDDGEYIGKTLCYAMRISPYLIEISFARSQIPQCYHHNSHLRECVIYGIKVQSHGVSKTHVVYHMILYPEGVDGAIDL